MGENKGLGDELRSQNRQALVKLAINSEHIRSLNLANSAAIALYENLAAATLGDARAHDHPV